jgi:hypothetical protein
MNMMPRVTTFGRQAVRIEARAGQFLDLDVVRSYAPAIFAEQPHESRSERFAHIPTHHMLEALMKEGFMPTGIRVGGSKDADKRAFTKHMIRLRRVDQTPSKVGGLFPEVVLKNGHDGTSQYHLMAGLFRMICMNGLVSPDTLIADVKVPHRGDAIQKVIEGSYSVLSGSGELLENAMAMGSVALTHDETRAFALAAAELRFDEVPQAIKDEPAMLLRARRHEDRRNDLWTTFNRAQENLTKGGIEFYREQGEGRDRRIVHQSTRPIQSVDGDIKMNRALWVLAEEMRKLKA